jgi:preprotein translocase subunit YajC
LQKKQKTGIIILRKNKGAIRAQNKEYSMVWNLLAESTNNGSTWVMMIILLVVVVVFMMISRRSQKKRQEETVNMLNAIKPGNKVKTIGGICGVVVEICDDNTLVLETGTEKSGKSYIKFDKQAVYQTDAVVEKAAPVQEETTKEEPQKVEEPFEETAQPQEENKAE